MGIIPERFYSNVLRLQYLNNVDIELKKITIVSDFGKKLFAYVVNAYEEELEL